MSKDEEGVVVDSIFLWLVCTSELVLVRYIRSLSITFSNL